MSLEVLTQSLTDAAVYNATNSTSKQETTSQFQWNGRTIGLAVGTGVLVITCVALGVLINPAFFGAIPVILGGAWALMGCPTINDLIGNSTLATREERQPILSPQNSIAERISSHTNTNGSKGTTNVGPTDHQTSSKINPTTGTSPSSLTGRIASESRTTYSATTSAEDSSLSSSPSQTQKAARKASSEFLKTISPNEGTVAIFKSVFGTDKEEINLNKPVDLNFAKNLLIQRLEKHSEFALEFLDCAEYLYDFQATAISSNLELTELEKIDAKIALCDGFILMIPNTESGNELVQHFNQKKIVFNREKQSLIQNLQENLTQSAQHLGQNVFPGQHGAGQGYTLSGEVQALIQDGDPRDKLQPISKEISTISEQIGQIDKDISVAQSQIQTLEKELGEIVKSAKLTEAEWAEGIRPQQDLGRDIRELYKVEIKETKNELMIINQKINSTRTRTELFQLTKERSDCYAKLLQLQYHYEILNLHLHVDAGYEHINNDKIELIIKNITRIKEELNLLKENAIHFNDQINKFKQANAETNHPEAKVREKALRDKEIARKNIARLLADPLSIETTHVEMPTFPSREVAQIYNVLNKGGGTSLQKYLDEIKDLDALIQGYSMKVNEMNNKLETLQIITNIPLTRNKLGEIRSTVISKNTSKDKMESNLKIIKDEKSKIENEISTLQENINKLSEHLRQVCNQKDFKEFVTTYRAFAKATNIPENQWASNILNLLSYNFHLLNQLPELKEPIVEALKANGIDTTEIQSKPLDPQPVPATTPLALMMSAGSTQPNFEDQIQFINSNAENLIPKSSPSTGSSYAQYKEKELEDILLEFQTLFKNLESLEERNDSTEESQETKLKIELQIYDIISVQVGRLLENFSSEALY